MNDYAFVKQVGDLCIYKNDLGFYVFRGQFGQVNFKECCFKNELLSKCLEFIFDEIYE